MFSQVRELLDCVKNKRLKAVKHLAELRNSSHLDTARVPSLKLCYYHVRLAEGRRAFGLVHQFYGWLSHCAADWNSVWRKTNGGLRVNKTWKEWWVILLWFHCATRCHCSFHQHNIGKNETFPNCGRRRCSQLAAFWPFNRGHDAFMNTFRCAIFQPVPMSLAAVW